MPQPSRPTPPPTCRPCAAPKWKPPPVGHVFVINLENKGFATTFGANSPAPYLAKTLRAKGNLLTQYYGTGHESLDNYQAQISGQGPNPQTQADCQLFTDFIKLPLGWPPFNLADASITLGVLVLFVLIDRSRRSVP